MSYNSITVSSLGFSQAKYDIQADRLLRREEQFEIVNLQPIRSLIDERIFLYLDYLRRGKKKSGL